MLKWPNFNYYKTVPIMISLKRPRSVIFHFASLEFSTQDFLSCGTVEIYFYYIHTEKYSPKSYVVNFRTQISSNQSEERTMVFTREENDTSNQNRERCFFTCEKNDTSNQKPQRCVSFAPKFPPFIAACSAASHTFNEKSFTQSFSR